MYKDAFGMLLRQYQIRNPVRDLARYKQVEVERRTILSKPIETQSCSCVPRTIPQSDAILLHQAHSHNDHKSCECSFQLQVQQFAEIVYKAL
jgi:hypothetical protein